MAKKKISEIEMEDQLQSIGALFESGKVRIMKDIEKLSPTKMAKLLQLNHARYIEKLYHPEQFTFEEIHKISILVGIEPNLISEVINKEIIKNLK
ncbi:hypothetical protein [Litoribacter populi]|uniref:hypothetical protein n=1 Tax=Litoribacter populi TaxID=2598460 RepID=UPI00117DEA3F|nr:hypothetical protein [Litoribacter populi]